MDSGCKGQATPSHWPIRCQIDPVTAVGTICSWHEESLASAYHSATSYRLVSRMKRRLHPWLAAVLVAGSDSVWGSAGRDRFWHSLATIGACLVHGSSNWGWCHCSHCRSSCSPPLTHWWSTCRSVLALQAPTHQHPPWPPPRLDLSLDFQVHSTLLSFIIAACLTWFGLV